MSTEQRLDEALERVKSAMDIWAAVPLGDLSDAVLEGVVEDRLADYYDALEETRTGA